MSMTPWELPWRGKMVPHAILDVLRSCNITCRACYNNPTSPGPKSLAQVQSELDQLLGFRRLSSVSLVGGEATLHPELLEIVKACRARGLDVELITNGLTVDEALCVQLKDAGLTIIYFHIERGQQRRDLPAADDAKAVNELRLSKVAVAAAAGLDVGLTVTAYPNEREDVRDAMALTFSTPEINYLLVTLYRDHAGVKSLRGNIVDGFVGEGTPQPESTRQSNRELANWMDEGFGLSPFCSMGSSLDPTDPRWLSYLVATVYDANGDHHIAPVLPSLLEKGALAIARLCHGRYPMYIEQDEARFRKQLVLNGWLGGDRASNRDVLARSKARGAKLTAKRILFQNPAELSADGRLIHCRWCPDAVIKNGALVPVCIADRVQ